MCASTPLHGNSLENHLPVLLEVVPFMIGQNLWFIYRRGLFHLTLAFHQFLNSIIYPHLWIGRNGPSTRASAPPDLNPLDFYFWKHLKYLIYLLSCLSEENLWTHFGRPSSISYTLRLAFALKVDTRNPFGQNEASVAWKSSVILTSVWCTKVLLVSLSTFISTKVK